MKAAVTSDGLAKKTPSPTKTEPMMARFCGVPLALMKEKRPPPCRSEPVATCAGGRDENGERRGVVAMQRGLRSTKNGARCA